MLRLGNGSLLPAHFYASVKGEEEANELKQCLPGRSHVGGGGL